MTPLETRLTDALAADVARFDAHRERFPARPAPDDEDLLQLRDVGPSTSGRGRRLLAAVAALALIGAGVGAFAALRDDDIDPVSDSATVPPTEAPLLATPPGVEEPLVEVPLTDVQNLSFVVKPGSAHAFHIEGHPEVLLWTTAELDFLTGQVNEWQCVGEAGGSGCGSVSVAAQFGQTSSIDNHVATDDLFTWSNLPPDVATARYDDGVVQLWQRPVAGLSIFRVDPNHPHPRIRAYDAAGALLPYSIWGDQPPQAPTSDTEASTDVRAIVAQAYEELSSLTQSSIRDCLTDNGASWSSANVPSFDADVNASAMWSKCLGKARSVVAMRLAELAQDK